MTERIYSIAHSVKRRPFMPKGGWIVKFNDVEVEVTKKFPASGISTIKIEIGED